MIADKSKKSPKKEFYLFKPCFSGFPPPLAGKAAIKSPIIQNPTLTTTEKNVILNMYASVVGVFL